MADLLKEVEAIPANYPAATVGAAWSSADVATIWQRIESYIRTRYTEREVVWTIDAREGEDWTPPLSPLSFYTAEKWESGAWVSAVLSDGPVGLCMPSDGVFRVTGTVGGGDVPAVVSEAYTRLARYTSAIQRTPGERLAMRKVAMNSREEAPVRQTPAQDATRVQETDGSVEYATNWPAKALQLSGAADLLRPYRRQK